MTNTFKIISPTRVFFWLTSLLYFTAASSVRPLTFLFYSLPWELSVALAPFPPPVGSSRRTLPLSTDALYL